jgi:hypothetical protein
MTPAVGTAAFGVHAEPALAAADLFDQEPDLTEYICHWSRRIGCIYVETPKVACTTIKRVLQAAELGVERRHEMPDDVHARATSPLLAPGHDPEGFALAIWDTATFRFTFVRNPYSRILSCWLDKMVSNETERGRMAPMLGLDPNTPPSLAEFLEAIAAQPERERDPHWCTQTHLLNPQVIRYDFIGRFEQFRGEFSRVCSLLAIEAHAGDLPGTWHATDASAKIQSHIGDHEAALIRCIYEADFRNFGYGWGTALV